MRGLMQPTGEAARESGKSLRVLDTANAQAERSARVLRQCAHGRGGGSQRQHWSSMLHSSLRSLLR